MRAVIQRVVNAKVEIEGKTTATINQGLLLLLGIEIADNQDDVDWLVGKISKLRIFDDPQGIMNLSVEDVKGEILIVSQFTLHALTKKGNRPSYIRAAPPDIALPLYHKFIQQVAELTTQNVQTGQFGAMMQVSLVNDGPVTIIMDSKLRDF
jgi:D-aminoacyl-tRNA deacylase